MKAIRVFALGTIFTLGFSLGLQAQTASAGEQEQSVPQSEDNSAPASDQQTASPNEPQTATPESTDQTTTPAPQTCENIDCS
jgi:hypothetical protein